MSIENEQNFGKYVRKTTCSVKPLKLQRFIRFTFGRLQIKNRGFLIKEFPGSISDQLFSRQISEFSFGEFSQDLRSQDDLYSPLPCREVDLIEEYRSFIYICRILFFHSDR